MSVLNLFCSSPGTGKTTRCIEIFQKSLKSRGGIDSRSYFILPSREHAERIRNLILKQGAPGLFNAHILTINDFATRLLPGVYAPAPSDAVRKRILRGLLAEGRGLEYFEKVKEYPGFYETLVDTLKEFKSGLLDIAEFEKRCQKLLKDPVFRSKFKSFTVLMKRYEEELEKARLEEPDNNFAKLLKDKGSRGLADLVIFDGFYHFTRAQRSFIAHLCRSASRVVVTLTLPENARERAQVFDYPMQTRKFLLGLGFKEEDGGENRRAANASLRHLEKNVFLEKPAAAESEGLKILRGHSPRGEMEIIAREIRRLYRESEMHYSDVCVIFRKIGAYRQLVKSVFSEFGIPVIVHERERLTEQGLGVLLCRFLKLLDEDWNRDDLIFLLKSSYLKTYFSREEAAKLESAALAASVTAGRENWKKLAGRALAPLEEWEASLVSAKNARAFGKALTALVESWSAEGEKEALRTIGEVLKNAQRFHRDPTAEFSPAAFLKELRDSLQSALFSLKPPGRNRVQVYDVVMAIPKEYKVVFMAGLLEKAFPQGISEDPLFKDAERRVLNGKDPVLEERRRRAAGERYFFYMGLSRARERLYLSHPKYDSEGRPTLASFFIEETEKCFRGIPEVRKEASDLVPLWDEWESVHDLASGLSSALFFPKKPGGSLPASVLKAVEAYRARPELKEVLRAGFSGGSAEIRDENVKRHFSGLKGPFSPTRLEIFATCAFKYFAGRVLKLNEPPAGREFLDMGNLLHKVLERFYVETPEAERNDKRFWQDDAEIFRRLSERLAREIEQSPLKYLPLYRRRVYEEKMRRALKLFSEHEKELVSKRNFAPGYFEFEFETLKIGPAGREVVLQGKIDRIDVDPATKKALVIDYKLSERPVSIRKKLSKGLELQIPLYLLAVRRILGLEAAGGELRFLNSASSEGLYRESFRESLGLSARKSTYSEEEYEAMLSETEKRVGEYVERLRSGDIAVKSKSCDYCCFSPVCRFESWRLVYSHE